MKKRWLPCAAVLAVLVPLLIVSGDPAVAAGEWEQQAQLENLVGRSGGRSVAVDMNTIVSQSHASFRWGAGGYETWDRAPDGTWAQADDVPVNGSSVDMDDGLVVVGNPGTNSDTGTVYVLERSGSGWATVDTLTGETAGDLFGWSVAIAGSNLVVGARGADTDAGADAGKVFVYTFDGAAFVESAELIAPDGAAGDEFGTSVAVEPGGRVVVGAPRHDETSYDATTNAGLVDGGAAYVSDVDSEGERQPLQKIVVPSEFMSTNASTAPTLFGWAVATSDVGLVAVGSPRALEIRVYGNTSAGWASHSRLQPPRFSGDATSIGTSLDWEGGLLAAGGPSANNDGLFSSGTAYIYEYDASAGDWLETYNSSSDVYVGTELVIDGEINAHDDIGYAVAVDRDTAVVGAPDFDGSSLDTGSTFAFVPGDWTYPEPPPPPEPDLRLRALEFNQVIQDWDNSVSLYAGKQTAVRVFLEQTGESSPAEVNGRLHGSVCGTPLPGSPLTSINGPVPLPEDASVREVRASIDGSLNYMLPADWLKSSFGCRPEFSFELSAPSPDLVIECAEPDFDAPDCIERIGFVEPVKPEMEFLYVPYEHGERVELTIDTADEWFGLIVGNDATASMSTDVDEATLEAELEDVYGVNERRVVVSDSTDESSGIRTVRYLVRTGKDEPDPVAAGHVSVTVLEQGGRVDEVNQQSMVELVNRIRDGLPTDGFDLSFGRMNTMERAPGLAKVNIKMSLRRATVLRTKARQYTSAVRFLGYLDGNAVNKGGLAYFKVSSVWENGVEDLTDRGHRRAIALHEVVHNYGKAHAVVFGRDDFPFIEIGSWRGLCGSVNASFEIAGEAVEPVPHPYVEEISGFENADALALWGEDYQFVWPTIGPLSEGAEREIWGLSPRLLATWSADPDGEDAGRLETLAIVDPYRTTELMSYCDNKEGQGAWPSWFTYLRTRQGILNADVGDDAYEFQDPQPYMMVGGSIGDDGAIELEAPFVIEGAEIPVEGPGDLRVALVDESDVELSAVNVLLGEDGRDHHAYGPESFDPGFVAAVPIPATGTPAALVISHDGEALERVEGSPNRPEVTFVAPAAGSTVDGPVIPIDWVATDADGDPLSTTVLYSPDDGESWDVLAVNVSGSAYSAPTDLLVGSEEARLRLAVSDGFHTTTVTSGRLDVGGGGPLVAISSPSTDIVRLAADTAFRAEAWGWDPIMGELSDAALAWESDITGPMGTGASITATLEEGCHEITVEAMGGNGRRGSASLLAEVGGAVCAELPAPGRIIIERQSPDAPTADYETTIPGYEAFGLTSEAHIVLDRVPPGSYEVIQLPLPDPWALASVRCLDNDSVGSAASGSATISISSGETVTCQFTDSDGATANRPPAAANDLFSVDEDTLLTVESPGILENDIDPDGDVLFVVDETSTANGSIAIDQGGSFEYAPTTDFCGPDGFTYRVTDGLLTSETAEVTIDVTCVDDAPLIDASPGMVQYSDAITPVVIEVTDVDSGPEAITLSAAGLPEGLSLGPLSCVGSGAGAECAASIIGTTSAPPDDYAVTLKAADGVNESIETLAVSVLPEDAAVRFHRGNPIAVMVDDGASGPFELTVRVAESVPDAAEHVAAHGDLADADVSMVLRPVGPGSEVEALAECERRLDGSGYDQELTVTCSFDDVPVNAYAVVAEVQGSYTSAGEDVLVVYAPSSGFAQGGGSFVWPDTADEVRFAFSMEHNRRGTNVKGGLMLVRVTSDGSRYAVKSNALHGLTLSEPSEHVGWVSFAGKATYESPTMAEPEGNHEFIVYAEDQGSSGSDRFWIEVRDKTGTVIEESSIPRPGPDHAEQVSDGEIVISSEGAARSRVE